MAYPVRRNGDQYYPRSLKNYLTDEEGNQTYARDRDGNQFYPERGKRFWGLARDRSGREYYARDRNGDEIYPVRKRRSVIMRDEEGNPKLAVASSGRQSYPSDGRGNEYYLLKERRPYLLRDESGTPYFARSRRNEELVPWNYYREERDGFRTETRDGAGNVVYADGEEAGQGLFGCVCESAMVCPLTFGLCGAIVPML